jgi:hypothetical protein
MYIACMRETRNEDTLIGYWPYVILTHMTSHYVLSHGHKLEITKHISQICAHERKEQCYFAIFCVNNKEMIYSSNVKFWGICITENLSWATHTQYVCQKLNKALYLIKSLHDSVSLPILNVYLLSLSLYWNMVLFFLGGGLKDTETVFKVQKNCLRVIKGVHNSVSYRNMFGELKILTVNLIIYIW